jgi:tRNA U34 5-carboxymethylaminomethyl modifying GTPase MnmE/TrmE
MDLKKLDSMYVSVTIKVKELIKSLNPKIQEAIPHLIEAIKIADDIFLRQKSHVGLEAINTTKKELENALKQESNSVNIDVLKSHLKYLNLFFGPYRGPGSNESDFEG